MIMNRSLSTICIATWLNFLLAVQTFVHAKTITRYHGWTWEAVKYLKVFSDTCICSLNFSSSAGIESQTSGLQDKHTLWPKTGYPIFPHVSKAPKPSAIKCVSLHRYSRSTSPWDNEWKSTQLYVIPGVHHLWRNRSMVRLLECQMIK